MMANKQRELLCLLKHVPAGTSDALVIPVGKPVIAYLRPVNSGSEINDEDVARLTAWRNRFVTAFLNEFEATESRTACWLRSTVAADDTRILFMCDDLSGCTFGYMGLAYIDWDNSYGEADAIVRGENAPRKGLMAEALLTLLRWANSHLGLQTLGVRVRSDNPALGFYIHLGFEEVARVPLVKTAHGSGAVWTEHPGAEPGAVYLVHMRIALGKLRVDKGEACGL